MTRPRIHSLVAVVAIIVAIGIGRFGLLSPPRRPDCADPAALMDATRITVPSHPIEPEVPNVERSVGFVKPQDPGDLPMRFSIRRAYMMTKWMVRPTLSVPGPDEPDVLESVKLDVGGVELPVTLARESDVGSLEFLVYLYALGPEPLSSPFWARARTAHEAFTSGLRPITLLSVSASAHRTRFEHERGRALEWIGAAWTHYLASCYR